MIIRAHGKIIKRNSDFPVAAHGAHGVPYNFDPAAVAKWWQANEVPVASGRMASSCGNSFLYFAIYYLR